MTENLKKRKAAPMAEGLANFLYDTPCERLVIGTLVEYTWAYAQVVELLSEDLFGDPFCRNVLKALLIINEKSNDFTSPQLMWEINKLNADVQMVDLLELSTHALTTPEQLELHTAHLADLYTRRRMAHLGVMMWEQCNDAGFELDDIISRVKSEMDVVLSSGTPKGTTTLKDSLWEFQTFINDRQDGKLKESGAMVGFPEVDDDGGLLPGQLVVVAGATAHGKSSLALSMTKQMLQQQIPIAYFSLEMPPMELTSRMLSMESGVTSSHLMHPTRKLEQQEFIDVARALGRVGENSEYLHFDARFSANIEQIIAAIRSMHYRYALRGVFIDYLQILGSMQRIVNREQFMGEVARRLKNLAVELNIWIVVLSQLNRTELGEEPGLKSIRDSGQIAEAADRVLLLFRPEANGKGGYGAPFREVDPHRTALLNLVKNRNGRTERFIVDFLPERTLFTAHEGELPLLPFAERQSSEKLTYKGFNFNKNE